MIASQKIGKSFMGALGYNIKKLASSNPKQRAELLDTNFSALDLDRIRQEVDALCMLRPSLKRYVYHTSLNFSKEETAKLNNEKMLAIACDYLEGMGYTNNQYMIFRHHDAGHPHIHLLVNRISFDGTVVSDSNNYRRSEALVRKLEKQYNLLPVYQSSYVALDTPRQDIKIYPTRKTFSRAPKKDEIEMAVRRGTGSNKMRLQEKLSEIFGSSGKLPISKFIELCEAQGISLLFNQASTGRISGITYFYGDFKARGQALGTKYKWAEILKYLDYEQDRDGQIVSQTNAGTKARYGELTGGGNTSGQFRSGRGKKPVAANAGADANERHGERQISIRDGNEATATDREDNPGGAGLPYAAGTAAQVKPAGDVAGDSLTPYAADVYVPGIYIADDEDDELAKRKRRRGR